MKHAEFDVERQSPQVQSAVAYLRAAAPADDGEPSLELVGVLS